MSESEDEGGLLPAALAGAGILLFAALMIFGTGDDEPEAKAANADGTASGAAKNQARGARNTGLASRAVDSAKRDPAAGPAMPQPPRGRMNPNVKKLMVTTEMTDPEPRQPPKFDNPDDERAFWEKMLKDAIRVRDMRQRGLDKMPKLETDARNSANPDAALDALADKKTRIIAALKHSESKIAELEVKVAAI